MRIGFDISQTGSTKAGCGFYAHALAERLLQLESDNDYVLLPSFGGFYLDPMMATASPYSGGKVSYGPRFIDRRAAATFWDGVEAERKLKLDLVHSNNFWCPTNFLQTRIIYTLYDLGFTVNPSWTTEANRLGCFNGVFRAAAYADWIVAISESSAREFAATFPNFPTDRIRVIYPCSRFSGAEPGIASHGSLYGLEPRRFWVSVGTIEPRKNQKMLLRAYAAYLARGGDPMPLVLAGGKGWLMDDLDSLIGSLGLREHVILTGYVSDQELIWLYRNCFANLYPSFYEGFGLPVLEGMQFGAAVLASNCSSLPEVVGSSGLLIDPQDVEGWSGIMLKVASGEIDVVQLRDAARIRSAAFDWSVSASALLELYRNVSILPKRYLAA
jgi:glycosyltransferase involved in cell wall biosynthesis